MEKHVLDNGLSEPKSQILRIKSICLFIYNIFVDRGKMQQSNSSPPLNPGQRLKPAPSCCKAALPTTEQLQEKTGGVECNLSDSNKKNKKNKTKQKIGMFYNADDH